MLEYKTQGVCSKKIKFKLVDGAVKDVLFVSGCDGNLKGIANLVDGMKIEEVISRLEGIKCGQKNTSCPAQLADALKQHSQI